MVGAPMRTLSFLALLSLPGCPKQNPPAENVVDFGDQAVGEVVELNFDWQDGWAADTSVHVEYREDDRVLVEERTASNVRVRAANGALFLIWGEGQVRPVTQVSPAPSHSWIGLHLHLARKPLIERVELDGQFAGAGRLEILDEAQQAAYDSWTTELLDGLEGRARRRRAAELEGGKVWFTEEQAQSILREEHESVTGRWIGKALEVGKLQEERGSIYVPTAGGMVFANVSVLAEGMEPCPGQPRLKCAVLRRDAEADSRLLTRATQSWMDARAPVLGESAPELSLVEAQRVERIWVEAETLRPWREEDTLTTYAELADGGEQTARESIVREWNWN